MGLRSSPGGWTSCASLQGCLAKSALCLPGWTSHLPRKISYLPGWNFYKRSKVDGTIPHWLAEQPRRRSRPGLPQRLPGWTSPCLKKSRTYLTCVASRCPGAALSRHCPSHKQSKVDGTIPRMGLQSSPGANLGLDFLKGCASLTPCKADLCLPGWTSPCLGKFRTYLAATCVAGLPRFPGAALAQALRDRSQLGRSQLPQLPARLPRQISPLLAWFDFPLPGKISYLPGWHRPSHKRRKVDGTIPCVGLQSSTGFERQIFACASSKAGLPQHSRLPLVALLPASKNLAFTWLVPVGATKKSRWHNSTHGLVTQPGLKDRS